MRKIKTILFDLGGVIITIDQPQAVRRFESLGLKNAAQCLDPYTQVGIFGDLEGGQIDDVQFVNELSKLIGNKVTWEECQFAWKGYCGEVPQRNLSKLLQLHKRGYRIVLVSNTNPFMMSWALSSDFDGKGGSLQTYLDKLYMSYKIGAMKPDPMFFESVIREEPEDPSECLFIDDGKRNVEAAASFGFNVFCPKNGEDWTQKIEEYI